jgi:hypothetical protein
MAGGVVQLPWYATGFRGDDLEAALQELAPLSTRHGATRYMSSATATTATSS